MVNVIEPDNGQYNNEVDLFWASGACLFINAQLYHKAGGLDNDFYAHMEEIDLCWRLKNMGYRIVSCPATEVYHVGGYIISYGSAAKVYRNHRNNLIMLLKNMGGFEAFWKITLRLFMDALTFVKMVTDGQFKASLGIIKGHWHFLFFLPKWLKSRKKAQLLKVKSNHVEIYPKSMVWQFFIKNKKTFTSLKWP